MKNRALVELGIDAVIITGPVIVYQLLGFEPGVIVGFVAVVLAVMNHA